MPVTDNYSLHLETCRRHMPVTPWLAAAENLLFSGLFRYQVHLDTQHNHFQEHINGLVQNYCNYLILYNKLQKFCIKPFDILTPVTAWQLRRTFCLAACSATMST